MADSEKRWQLMRFTVDVVVDADNVPNEYRRESIAEELTQNLHVTILEPEDGANVRIEKFTEVHIHDASEQPCRYCYVHVADEKNGNIVVQQAEMV